MNIKFCYQYRDGANYKNHKELIFSNKLHLSLEEIHSRICNNLISGEFFIAKDFNVPDLHFEKWDSEIDHDWHEFREVEETDEENTYGDINDFLQLIERRIRPFPEY